MTASRRQGTAWESRVVDYLHGRGWPGAERRAMRGAHDAGDVAGVPLVCIECKSAARIELAAWIDEATQETRHASAEIGAVWAKRKGRTSPGDGYVVMTGATFTQLLKEAGYQ